MTETRAESTAAYPEPPQGATREEHVKAMLKAAYRNPGSTPINSRETTVTGRALSERFTDQLDVLAWVREPYLTARQVVIVELIFRDDLTLEETARALHLTRSAVSQEKRQALQAIIRIAWNEPEWVLPYRFYTRTLPAPEVLTELRRDRWA